MCLAQVAASATIELGRRLMRLSLNIDQVLQDQMLSLLLG